MAEQPTRLDAISTRWSLLERPAHHGGDAPAAAAARAEFLERYGGAVRRYLLGALKDADAADELFQEFASRFLHGNLKGARPDKGRFRDFLKGVVSHLVADHCKARRRQLPNLPDDLAEPAVQPAAELDRLFQESWRDELLEKTWQSLAEEEKVTGQPWHTVLRFRADHPDLRSAAFTGQLGEALRRPLTDAGARQLLHRARKKYADLLRQHVLDSLSSGDPDDVDRELADLGLLPYVRP